MARPQLRGTPSQLAVDLDHSGADGVKELIHLRFRPTPRRAHHHLGVDAGTQEDVVASVQPNP